MTASSEKDAPLLLDLFCCEGGAAQGYADAGFRVIGIDTDEKALERYPFECFLGDALDLGARWLDRPCGFAAVHASPPCQARTSMSNRYRGQGGKADSWPNLIAPVRDLLVSSGLPYVLENVPGARADLLSPVLLHGGMFGLGVDRPRLFESNMLLLRADAPRVANPLGVYGKLDGRRLWTRADGTEQRAARTVEQAGEAMGIDWMSWDGLRECIPPSYTRFIGEQLLAHVSAERAA